jgi:hypothetical protein
MFWTIIKPLYEELVKKGMSEKEALKKACYNSLEMRRNWSQEKIEEWNSSSKLIDCSNDKTLQTDKVPVSYIPGHDRTYRDGYYYVRAHFRLHVGSKVSYKVEEDKHLTAQHILAGLILNKEKIRLNYRHIPFYLDEIELDLKNRTSEHFLEQSYIEEEMGINRRADLLFELKTPNLTFGRGFVFEIVNTESMDSIKEKAMDWARAGYSLIVIPISNFDFDNYGLKKDNYLIMYQLFDDLNVYLELMKKIKQNEPLIDSFNDNVKEMETKMFFWRSGRHTYEFKDREKVNEILLYCIGSEVKNFKTKTKIALNCYDAGNKLIDVDIWQDNPLFDQVKSINLRNQLLRINSASFSEYQGKVSLVLSQWSKIKKINIKENEDAKED